MKNMIIALPPKLYILRPEEKQDIRIDNEEYNIYFQNIILPYSDHYDVKVECDYGRNYGSFWRISDFPYHINEFDLEIKVYDEYGQQLAENACTVIMTDKKENPKPYRILCVGDSMTRSFTYINHISHKLMNLEFCGIRSYDGHTYAEGRGGWSYATYFNNYCESPFLFPQGVEAERYFGDMDFESKKENKDGFIYSYKGFRKSILESDMIYHKEGKLWHFNHGNHYMTDEEPKWDFSFRKYVEKNKIPELDCVSLLMGANDLSCVDYKDSDKCIDKYVANTEKFVASVKEYDSSIAIILNLPIAGADQIGWGKSMGCKGSAKQYTYNMIKASQALIDKWGNSEDHIYLSAMSLNIDRKVGFGSTAEKSNRYSDSLIYGQDNNVHPNQSGYMQMGDALAAVIEYVRGETIL